MSILWNATELPFGRPELVQWHRYRFGCKRACRGTLTRPYALMSHELHCVRCIMMTRATFKDSPPADRLPKYDGVELILLLLGIGALTVLAVAG